MANRQEKGPLQAFKDYFKAPASVTGSPSEVRSETGSNTSASTSVLPPARPTSSTVVTADAALSIAGVYRAVAILGDAVSQLPIGVWRNGAEIDTPSLVKQPNADLSRTVFVEQTVNSLALTGNAYWRLFRQSATSPVANIEVLNPHLVYVEVDDKGRTWYRYGDKRFAKWQVRHLQLMRVPGSTIGLGPIQAAQGELAGAIDLRDYSTQWFRSGGVPNGVLSTPNELTSEMADAYRQRWNEQQANGRGVAVLGNGLAYQPVYLSPKDALFIESQDFNIQQVARLFGIPATYLIADANNSMTYSNQETVDQTFARYTLMGYMTEIEDALTAVLPRGQEAKFKVEGLLRADTKTRYESYKVAIEAGFLTVDEVRAKEGLLPLPASAKPAAPVVEGNTNDEGEPA